VPASASQADDYTNAIHRALTLVQFAEGGDTPSIGQALQVLATAPGPSQPEILRDLGADPPNLTDADQRLQALYAALQARVDTPDPERARQHLTLIVASLAQTLWGEWNRDQRRRSVGRRHRQRGRIPGDLYPYRDCRRR